MGKQKILPLDEEPSVGVFALQVTRTYPIEEELVNILASSKAFEGDPWNMVDQRIPRTPIRR